MPAAVPNPLGKSQLTHYALAWLKNDTALLEKARAMSADYFFPSRLHDQLVLEWALAQDGADRNAAFGLGNYLFDRKRHEEAIAAWETARAGDPAFATVCRNLGIAYWNVRRDGGAAREAYLQALKNDPSDPRLFYEYDQLRKKLNDPAGERLAALEARPGLVAGRDDCTVELAALYNQTAQPERALETLLARRFHPWEGGEGQVLRQYTAARLLLGRKALEQADAAAALEHFKLAMNTPENLGEAYHLLQAKADVNYWTGKALRALGRETEAVEYFENGAFEAGDFQAMAVTEHSELSYYRGLSLVELGRFNEAKALFEALRQFAEKEMTAPAETDYFATSLPLLLVFEDDSDISKRRNAACLLELARKGLSEIK
jgi:tetratricopeptide (TPR) repeat protein